jgi:hypothetical protein
MSSEVSFRFVSDFLQLCLLGAAAEVVIAAFSAFEVSL